MSTSSTAGPALRRVLGPSLITLYGLGTTIGGGIYVLIGSVAERAGLNALVSFVIAAVLIGFTALSYAELASRFPVSAGSAVYVSRGFGRPRLGLGVGCLVIFAAVVSAAVLARGFAAYFHVLFDVPSWLAIVGIVALIGLLAAWGIGQSVLAASAITVLEVGGLLLVLWAGRAAFGELPDHWMEFVPRADLIAWSGILGGAVLAFFAFIGFEDMVNVAEEVKDAEKALPRAILITLVLTTLLYLSVAYVTLSGVPLDVLRTSEAPLTLVAARHSDALARWIAVIGTVSVLNGALIQIIMAARVVYGMARQGWIHARLGQVHVRTQTPIAATTIVTLSVIVLALSFPIGVLAQTTSLIVLVTGTLVNAALLRMKLRREYRGGHIDLPKAIPLLGMLSSAAFGLVVALNAVHTLD
jgi:amino acid transporter